jgi:hypothetical protein
MVHADDVKMLVVNIDTVKKTQKHQLILVKEVGLEVNSEETINMLLLVTRMR